MKNDLIKIFIEEVTDLIQELEASLLALEKDASNKELLNKSFRALHTIKGAAGMYGYNEISSFTHCMETIFDNLRNDKIKLTNEILTYTLNACDVINKLITDTELKIAEVPDGTLIYNFFSKYITNEDSESAKAETNLEKDNNLGSEKIIYIKFVPRPDFLLNGSNPLLLIEELKELGKAITVCHTEYIPDLDLIAPENCYLSWEIILLTSQNLNAVKDVFIFAEDISEIIYSDIDCKVKFTPQNLFEQIKEEINKRNIIEYKTLSKIINDVTESEKNNSVKNHVKHSEINPVVKVTSEKLDILVNLVGELVTAQAGLLQNVKENSRAGIEQIAEEIDRITWELRDTTLNLRMVPFSTLFNKLNRLVRDLSLELEKDIEFETSGGETELDKGMVEKLSEPLIHIIRNSIDHGIETPDERIKNNKASKGKIILSAVHSGDSVHVIVSDDGKGLIKEKIIAKAVQNKIIEKAENLSDAEIINLIFAPGFSTAENVTSVSGRGVGMDVVKRTIEELGGTVTLKSVEKEGCEIKLILPLTMAIIEGLLIKLGVNFYVIPLKAVEEVVEITRKEIYASQNHSIVSVRNNFVPYIKLRQKFSIKDAEPEIQQIVIISVGGEKIGLLVDNVIGQHQSVIKSLGKEYKHIEEISGGTILGDGTMALILNTTKFLTRSSKQ